MAKLKVKLYCTNKGQPTQAFGLKLAEKGNEQVLPYAPNNWKTERGAVAYAEKRGYVVTNKSKAKPKVAAKAKAPSKPKATKATPKATTKKSTPKKTTAKAPAKGKAKKKK